MISSARALMLFIAPTQAIWSLAFRASFTPLGLRHLLGEQLQHLVGLPVHFLQMGIQPVG